MIRTTLAVLLSVPLLSVACNKAPADDAPKSTTSTDKAATDDSANAKDPKAIAKTDDSTSDDDKEKADDKAAEKSDDSDDKEDEEAQAIPVPSDYAEAAQTTIKAEDDYKKRLDELESEIAK